ncbi:MAG: RHS repeat domain-containing protein [Thermoanaerobaculaceae bacterium]
MRKTHLLDIAVAVASFAAVVRAEGPFMGRPLERGFAADRVYSLGKIDTVELSSGTVNLAIPLGPEFKVSDQFSFRFSLAYDSKVWTMKQVSRVVCPDPTDPSHLIACWKTQAYPNLFSNAGLGWTLSLGRLIDPGDSRNPNPYSWVFIGPDGSENPLGKCEDDYQDCPSLYSRDGKYFRRQTVDDNTQVVETPDGKVYEFARDGGNKWRLSGIRDHFAAVLGEANSVVIHYYPWTYQQGSGTATGVYWKVTDSASATSPRRTHHVYEYADGSIAKVVLNATSPLPSEYVLSYGYPRFPRSSQNEDLPPTGDMTVDVNEIDYFSIEEPRDRARLLTSVTLPDGSMFSMEEGGVPSYYSVAGGEAGAGPDTPGVLRKIVLPTGGAIRWVYKKWEYTSNFYDDSCTPNPPLVDCRVHSHTEWSGLDYRQELPSASATDGPTWTYLTWLAWQPHYDSLGGLPEERVVVVRDPDQNDTVHYFRPLHDLEDPDLLLTQWDYALPFTRRVQDDPLAEQTEGPWLSVEHWAGKVVERSTPVIGETPTDTLLRTEFVSYDHDDCPESVGGVPSDCGYRQSERLVVQRRTVFGDDCVGATCSTSEVLIDQDAFDGFGHGRIERTKVDFTGTAFQVKTVGYNPNTLGEYPRWVAGIDGTNRWPLDKPWLLGTFDKAEETDGASHTKTLSCFERDSEGFPTTGFLSKERVLANGVDLGTSDLVRLHERDAAGNVTHERYAGGDLSPVATNTALCNYTPAPEFQLDHDYTDGQGLRTKSGYFNPATSASMGFYFLDRTVEATTGRVSSARDMAGLQVDYAYDISGRLESEKPAQEAWTRYKYSPANELPVWAEVLTCSKTDTACATPLAAERFVYDGFGRIVSTKKVAANGSYAAGPWDERQTTYDQMGRKSSESVWFVSGTAPPGWTRYVYDRFGRTTEIQQPDFVQGSKKHTLFDYEGVRRVTRTQYVWGNDPEHPGQQADLEAKTVETYDALGRLVKVEEMSAGDTSQVPTTYTYDVAGHLTSVALNDLQTRQFSYDGRGFLTSETIPEKTDPIHYAAYDAMGHLRRKWEGKSYLVFDLDKAERPTGVSTANASWVVQDTLRSFTYWPDNLVEGGQVVDWRKGKTDQAVALNPSVVLGSTPTGTVQVTHTYAYRGLGGRVSTRDTVVTVSGSSNDYTRAFTQGFSWDPTGQPSALSYPRCSNADPCGGVPERNVYFRYAQGLLDAVLPSYASSLTYHPGGLVASVVHGNPSVEPGSEVKDLIELDAFGQPRPVRMRTMRGTENLWSSGTYDYDPSGNIKGLADDGIKGRTDGYVYDRVSRVVEGNLGTNSETYEYDVYGNMKKYNGTAIPLEAPGGVPNNRLGTGASYNNRGSLEQYGGFSFTWDPLDQMRGMTSSTLNRAFAYDADGERVFIREATQDTFTLRGLDGKLLREVTRTLGQYAWQKDLVWRGGTVLASVGAAEGITHLHVDHLGTTRLVTDRCGRAQATFDLFPFGKTLGDSPQNPQRIRFTGHERDLNARNDDSDDFDYMHARYYGVNLRRFLSSDPVGGDRDRPQSWNSYSYSEGRPLIAVDRDGRTPAIAIGATIGWVVGAGMAAYQEVSGGKSRSFWDVTRNVVAGAAGGAVAGGIAGACGGCQFWGSLAVGGAASVVGGGVRRTIDVDSKTLDLKEAVKDAATGVAGGGGGYLAGKALGTALAPAIEKEVIRAASGRAVAQAESLGQTGVAAFEAPARQAIRRFEIAGLVTGAVAGEASSAGLNWRTDDSSENRSP